MFLSSVKDFQHELDFRFELFPEVNEFFFIHHGLNISELVGRIDISKLGSVFYMTEADYSFTIDDVIADKTVFSKRYGIEPTIAYDRYLRFDLTGIETFFSNARADNELDFTIFGTHADELSQDSLRRLTATLAVGQSRPFLTDLRNGCWFGTHDNNFFFLLSQTIDLLPSLIEESILGFFHQIRAHAYQRLPTTLIDLIIAQYHTSSLLCFPTATHNRQDVPSDVQIDENGIRALIKTAKSWWTACNLDLPSDMLGRTLLLSYSLSDDRWSWQEWK
jgi:hypothetical protein